MARRMAVSSADVNDMFALFCAYTILANHTLGSGNPPRAAVWLQSGNLNASNSPEYDPPLTARTMYCLPLNMYVIGAPLSGAGM
jgi:hypothetical protein